MRKELGIMIRNHREKRRLKAEELARKLNISAHYVRHLETECPSAKFSEGLMERVVKTLRLPRRKALSLADAHNRRVKRYLASLKPRKTS